MKVRNFHDERSGNRVFPAGRAQRRADRQLPRARVLLNAAPVPLHLDETPVTAVPDEVLHYLLPSRYCESDSLNWVAQQLFGKLPPGLQRVKAIEKLDLRVG